jgi:hypothetical protein
MTDSVRVRRSTSRRPVAFAPPSDRLPPWDEFLCNKPDLRYYCGEPLVLRRIQRPFFSATELSRAQGEKQALRRWSVGADSSLELPD